MKWLNFLRAVLTTMREYYYTLQPFFSHAVLLLTLFLATLILFSPTIIGLLFAVFNMQNAQGVLLTLIALFLNIPWACFCITIYKNYKLKENEG